MVRGGSFCFRGGWFLLLEDVLLELGKSVYKFFNLFLVFEIPGLGDGDGLLQSRDTIRVHAE
jgi:hypothetical protein